MFDINGRMYSLVALGLCEEGGGEEGRSDTRERGKAFLRMKRKRMAEDGGEGDGRGGLEDWRGRGKEEGEVDGGDSGGG